MKIRDVLRMAMRNSFRSRLRTFLTIVAIFIGAFTLTITNGLGTGINRYIDDTLASIGGEDVLTVSKTVDDDAVNEDGIREFDPEENRVQGPQEGPPGTDFSLEAITGDDLDELTNIDGVLSVEPQLSLAVDSISTGGKEYVFMIASYVPGLTLQLAAGDQPGATSSDYELTLPLDYVKTLGFDDPKDAVGEEVVLALTDSTGVRREITATVAGVTEDSLVGGLGGNANPALGEELYRLQSEGISADDRDSYAQAILTFDQGMTDDEVQVLRDELGESGYDSLSVDEEIGAFKTVIDGIILVLNAFGFIALLAAGFGIVNTLLMSVQERTREIGLMKAMGLGSGKVFGLFSTEAVFLGFLGSALGSLGGILVGNAISSSLASGFLGDLPGLVLIAFTPASVLGVVLLVMAIAFVAGTLPASRAARQHPIDALRYE